MASLSSIKPRKAEKGREKQTFFEEDLLESKIETQFVELNEEKKSKMREKVYCSGEVESETEDKFDRRSRKLRRKRRTKKQTVARFERLAGAKIITKPSGRPKRNWKPLWPASASSGLSFVLLLFDHLLAGVGPSPARLFKA